MPKWLTWSLAIGVVLLLVALDGVVLWRVRLARPATAQAAAALSTAARVGGSQVGAASAGGRAAGAAATASARGAKAEICGSEHAPVDTTDPFAVTRYLEAMTHATGQRWLSALRDSDDTRERAAGMLLEGMLAEDGQILPVKEETRDALVQFAVGAADPLVYAFAWYACSRAPGAAPDSACSQLSLDAWARLDTDNAVPWLLLAAKARDRHEAAAESEAFGRAAAARRVDAYDSALLQVAAPAFPQDGSPLARWYLAGGVLGIEAALRPAYAREAVLGCAAAGVGAVAAGTRAQCAVLADALVSKGVTLLDLGAGARVGALAGWPPERAAAVIEERDALAQALAQSTPTRPENQWSCEGVRLGNVYLAERGKSGELAAARTALQHSNQTVPALAQRQREYVETLYRQALAGDDIR